MSGAGVGEGCEWGRGGGGAVSRAGLGQGWGRGCEWGRGGGGAVSGAGVGEGL